MKVGTPFPCSRIDEIAYDYLESALEPQERKLAEHHLSTCPSCSRALWETEQMLRGLAALKEEPEGDVVEALVGEFRQVSARKSGGQAVEERTHQEDRGEDRGQERLSSGPPGLEKAGADAVASRGMGWAKLLAAGLAAVSLALAFWVLHLRGQLEELSSVTAADRALDHDRLASLESQLGESRSELARSREAQRRLEEEVTRLSQPQASVPTAYIYPPAYLRNSADSVTVSVPPAAGFFQLIFVVGDDRDFLSHQVSVLRRDGTLVWRSDEVPGDGSGHITTLFRRSFLPSGTYRAALFGLAEDRTRSELARYEWELVYE